MFSMSEKPSPNFAVIVAFPTLTPVTFPDVLSTVATSGLLELYVIEALAPVTFGLGFAVF